MGMFHKASSSFSDDSKKGSSTSSSNKRKPKYSRFTQQELPALKPILTPGWAITAFAFIAMVFIPLGLVSLLASSSVVEIGYRYDEQCVPATYNTNPVLYIQSTDTNKTCTTKFTVTKQMKAPVFVYYQLENFYQNHRRYVKSRNDKQLRRKAAGVDTKSSCHPKSDANGKPIVPCGLIAWSLFNDTYRFSAKDKDLTVNKKNIAWKSDKEAKFGSDVYPKNFQTNDTLIGGAKLNESIPLSEQEDLLVWMRTAALPTFRKLYGRIEIDLEVNDEVKVVIENNYNTYSFEGKKWVILSTASWNGGKNNFLGKAYLTVGGLSLFFALAFILLHLLMPRPLGDPSYLSWNKNVEKIN